MDPELADRANRIRLDQLEELRHLTAYVRLTIPIPIEEIEDGLFPKDYPRFANGSWEVEINIKSGQICDWPHYDRDVHVQLKLIDCGHYALLDETGNALAKMSGHVPNKLLPGSFGEYLTLDVSKDGRIANWPTSPSLVDYLPDPSSFLDYQLVRLASAEPG